MSEERRWLSASEPPKVAGRYKVMISTSNPPGTEEAWCHWNVLVGAWYDEANMLKIEDHPEGVQVIAYDPDSFTS